MKKLLSIIGGSLFLVGCINSSTNFTNRSITNMATHELIGDKAYVTESPHSNDSHLNAEKTNETKLNGSGTGTVNDNSTNEQKASGSDEKKDEPKSVEKPMENVEDTQNTPEN